MPEPTRGRRQGSGDATYMPLCRAADLGGNRCPCSAVRGSEFCSQHHFDTTGFPGSKELDAIERRARLSSFDQFAVMEAKQLRQQGRRQPRQLREQVLPSML